MNNRNKIFFILIVAASVSAWFYSSDQNLLSDNGISIKKNINSSKLKKTLKISHPRKESIKHNNEASLNDHRPQLPHESYLLHIEAAEQGDPRSMYLVSASLGKCRWGQMPASDYIDQLIIGGLSSDATTEIADQIMKCKKLYEVLNGEDLIELRDAWLDAAIEAGDTFAWLDNNNSQNNYLKAHEVEQLLYKALGETNDSEYLKQRVFFHVEAYYNTYIALPQSTPYLENSQFTPNNTDQNAWAYLTCKHLESCSDDWYQGAYLSAGYTQTDIDDAMQRANEFINAIERKNWKALSLNPQNQ